MLNLSQDGVAIPGNEMALYGVISIANVVEPPAVVAVDAAAVILSAQRVDVMEGGAVAGTRRPGRAGDTAGPGPAR